MTQNFIQNLAALGTLVAAVVAAASFVWAVFQWREQRQHQELQAFRNDIIEFRAAMQLFIEAASDLPAIEIGNLASEFILDISGAQNGLEMKEFLQSADKTEVFIGAGIRASSKSLLLENEASCVSILRRSSGRQNENFPITNHLTQLLAAFVGRMTGPEYLSRAIHGLIENSILPGSIIDDIADEDSRGVIFSKLSDHFSQIASGRGRQKFKPASMVAQVVSVIVGNYLNRSDSELWSASRLERKARSQLPQLKSDTFTGEIVNISNLYQPLLSSPEWTELVELRTKLDAEFTDKNEA